MARQKKAQTWKEKLQEAGKAEETVTEHDWAAASAESMHRLVVACTAHGCLVSFSKTRNASALVLTFMHPEFAEKGNPYGKQKYYFSEEEVDEQLDYWAGFWGS